MRDLSTGYLMNDDRVWSLLPKSCGTNGMHLATKVYIEPIKDVDQSYTPHLFTQKKVTHSIYVLIHWYVAIATEIGRGKTLGKY